MLEEHLKLAGGNATYMNETIANDLISVVLRIF